MAKFYVESGCLSQIVISNNFMEAAIYALKRFLEDDNDGCADLGQDVIMVNECGFINDVQSAEEESKRVYSFVVNDIEDIEIDTSKGQIVLINTDMIVDQLKDYSKE